MRSRSFLLLSFLGLAAAGLLAGCVTRMTVEPGFTSLFDGHSLKGWRAVGAPADSYIVQNGVIVCTPTGKNLFTESEYGDFILRFEFKLTPGANNGIGIRAPFEGDAAYVGMEIQILDEVAALAGQFGKLRPEQFHGSIYDLVPARRGALKPVGEWNEEEIVALGRNIRVILNGNGILDANLGDITDAEKLRRHPGLSRERGHIGFLGHGDHVEFRRIRIKDLSAKDRPRP